MDTKLTLSLVLCLATFSRLEPQSSGQETAIPDKLLQNSSPKIDHSSFGRINNKPVAALQLWDVVEVKKNASGHSIIQWSILEKDDALEFLVQRSTDGRCFRAFKRIVKDEKTTNYRVEDTKAKGYMWYRIIKIDKDGNVYYSKVVKG